MTHPLVTQLHFARSEFVRGLEGVTAEQAIHRFEPMNCLSWLVGHLANQEQFFWISRAQGRLVDPALYKLVGYGRPASTPPWDDMWSRWRTICAAADEYLLTVNDEMIQLPLARQGVANPETIGVTLLRNTYHYWYHLGEALAIRQMLGGTGLPEFVGDMASVAVTTG
jgi:hypothetical protein